MGIGFAYVVIPSWLILTIIAVFLIRRCRVEDAPETIGIWRLFHPEVVGCILFSILNFAAAALIAKIFPIANPTESLIISIAIIHFLPFMIGWFVIEISKLMNSSGVEYSYVCWVNNLGLGAYWCVPALPASVAVFLKFAV